ncbi:TRAP transporter permease [Natronorubrum texcoconense]|uniref:TRAP transporter, 4TM/12TM fusion protein n=1 Tax=Natronorubrum texcoconense TaxID=1095776 RepID=A0A1G8YW78_9EURY|nr:TRAP transporter fused permease subunit [Natronorubrum texcoconense]SDK07078.1 TRAP transporter, 4TM/12TM fusion protein [Natronorubrum texcoconense]
MSTETTTPVQQASVKLLDNAVTVGAIVFWAIVLFWMWTQTLPRAQYGVLFIGSILALYVLDQARESIADEDYLDLLILAACFAVMAVASTYMFLNFEGMYQDRQGWAYDYEYNLAWLVIAVILYLTWRSYGNVFLVLIGGAMVYSIYGYLVPGILGHGGISTTFMLQMLITDMAGFYGSLTQLTGAWIAPFLLYAGLLFAYGAFDLILRIAIVTAKYIESGVAQTAVLASAVIGSINGSYAANAGMTGSFTIPTMMDSGLRGRTAAAIEGTASTSGQVLPPVMGASAFVMASFLGIAYIDVIVAGLIPAAILLISIAVAVHYTSVNEIGDQELDFQDYFDEQMTRNDKIVEGIRFGIPFSILLVTLGYYQWTVMTSALWTIVAMVTLGLATPVLQEIVADRTDSDGPVHALTTELKNTVGGFRRGAIILAPIAIILAAVNGVVDLLMVTGIPSRIALLLMDLSGGVLLIAVLLGMAVCIVMGVGMPTVAAYVIVSTLVAPAFVNQFGVPELAAHYMVFYAAVMAGVTPPVAIAVVVASGIAESNFWETCGVAITIAAPLFVLPISFIYHPEIVSSDLGLQSVFTGLVVLAGALTIIYGINFPFDLKRRFRLPLRFGLFWLGAFIMVYPGRIFQLAGIGVFALIFFAERAIANGWDAPFVSSST